MIRIFTQEVDRGGAVHVGGPVTTRFKAFDVDCPDLENWLKEPDQSGWELVYRSVVGAELVKGGKQ